MKKVDMLNFITSYIGIGIMFFLTMARAKVFTPTEIGIYSYIISIATIFSGVLNFGIQRIILRYYNQNKNSDFLKKILKIQVVIFIIFSLGYFIFCQIIEIKYVLFMVLLTFNLLMIANIDMISMVTNKSTKSNLYQKIYMNFLDLLILGIMFYIKGDIYNYLFVYIIIKYIALALMVFLVKEEIFIETNEKVENKDLKIYFSYGLFIMLNAAASILINTIDKIMLKSYIDFKAVGIYTISLTLGSAIGMVGNVFCRSVPPQISKCLETEDNVKLEKIYKENAKQQIYIGLFLLICLIIFSKEVLALMGKEYIDGYMVLTLIGIGQMVNIGTGMCGNIIGLSKFYKYEAYFNILLLAVTIGTNMLLIPIYGIVGAAFATALTLVLINIMKVIFVYRKFNMHPYRLENLKFIVAGLMITIILYIIKQFVMLNIVEIGLVSIFIFGIYDGVLYLLKDKDVLSLKVIKRIK